MRLRYRRPRAVVVVVQPDDGCGPGWLDEWLPAEGVAPRVVRPAAGEALPDPAEAAGLIVLGGPMASWEHAAHPWLADIEGALRRAVDEAVPMLGICLGAQLLARTAGGRVERGAGGPEVGARLVEPLPAAARDPLLSAVFDPPEPRRAVQWHDDAIVELPPDAVHLARSDAYAVQAFRVGGHAWGVQFHPEATLPIVAGWARSTAPAHAALGIDDDAALADIAARQRDLEAAWRPLARRFAALLRPGRFPGRWRRGRAARPPGRVPV